MSRLHVPAVLRGKRNRRLGDDDFDAIELVLDTLTLRAPAAGAPADGTLTLASIRHDGLTGTTRAKGPIMFPEAWNVQAADLDALYATQDGDEVAIYVEDLGMRYDGPGQSGAVRGAWVEVDATHAVANDEPTFVFAFKATGSPAARLTSEPFTPFDNALDPRPFASDPAQLCLHTGVAYEMYDADGVKRTTDAATAATWHTDATGYTLGATVTAHATLDTRIAVLLMAHRTTGALRAVPVGAQTVATGNRVRAGYAFEVEDKPAYMRGAATAYPDWQLVGEAVLYLDPTFGDFTFGTTSLLAAGVTFGTIANGLTPYSLTFANMPAATLTPVDPAVLTTLGFLPWAIPTSAACAAAGGDIAAMATKTLAQEDIIWAQGGSAGPVVNNTSETAYAPMLVAWTSFCASGRRRLCRRSLAYWEPWADVMRESERLQVIQSTQDPGWHKSTQAANDTSQCPWRVLFTRDPEALANLDHVLDYSEHVQLTGGNGPASAEMGSGTARDLMHVFQGLFMRHLVGIRTARPSGPYWGAGAHQHTGTTGFFTDAANRLTDGTNEARLARAYRMVNYLMRTHDQTGVGLRQMLQSAYGYHPTTYQDMAGNPGPNPWTDPATRGNGPWMMHFLTHWAEACNATITQSSTFETDTRDATEWVFSAKRLDGVTPLMLCDFGAQGSYFQYSEWEARFYDVGAPYENNQPTAPGGANHLESYILIPTAGWTLAQLHARTGDAIWLSRSASLLKAIAASPVNGYHGKFQGDIGLGGWPWLAFHLTAA